MTLVKFKLGRTPPSKLYCFLNNYGYEPDIDYIIRRRRGKYQLIEFLLPVDKTELTIWWDVIYTDH